MSKRLIPVLLAALSFASLPAAAETTATAPALPAICQAGMHHAMDGAMGGNMGMMGGMGLDEAHQDLAKGMDETNAQMMQGMMAEDIDVAFVCAMIPHHQAAINMAKAELAHGDNDWAKAMAQKVIDAQEKEIADMRAWLAEQK